MEKERKPINEKKNKEKEVKTKINKKLIIIVIIAIVSLLSGIAFAIYRDNNLEEPLKEQGNIRVNNDEQGNIRVNNDLDFIPVTPLKPIIYLYPEEETKLTVKLGNKENITCSYPEYKDGWKILAKPDGTLIDLETNRKLYALYWEGKNMESKAEYKEGYCIKGEDTAKFLEEKLEKLGLNYKESEEFIIYWLPKLEKNKYNYIRFASMEEINEYMPLEISKEPDTIIRVLMEYKPLDKYIEVKEQELEMPERKGFTVVEWGGTEILSDIVE